ncbi:hypothetical protein AMS68_005736 [Peltaster fructicola]|uniref:Swiss Army Knife RNA repair protein HAD domain-containing protein n=1 Tax=Peltaster fructicola TaxID=286661 RepID=A0A6H0Y027_9PEZI|nr:hypothetical protein AMS68_005736 [Peltaster fructicola]
MSVHTPTALKRWSCSNSQLPPVKQIKRIHIYDFDNTLFLSPLPNKQLWNTTTFGALQAQEYLHDGGWWHNQAFSLPQEGIEKEEPRAWEGAWNEHIVDLARITSEDTEALSVLLTGRGEKNFSELLQRIFKAKGLRFDIVALKPAVSPTGKVFDNTLQFKTTLLRDIVYTYTDAEELRMYEDRPKHTKAFRDFFEELNGELIASRSDGPVNAPRKPIDAEVIQVAEVESYMDPVKEVAEIQSMINSHNKAIVDGMHRGIPYKIKRSVFYTGYLISAADSDRLKKLVRLPARQTDQDVKWLANNILITPRPATQQIMDKVGGIGATTRWKVTGLGSLDQRIWAARVAPTDPNTKIYTENSTPYVVLATRRQTKPIDASRIHNWQNIAAGQSFEFDTTVGEKVLLRIDEERANEDDYEASFANTRNGKRTRDEDFPALGSQRQPRHNGRTQQKTHAGNQSAWSANRGIGAAAQRGGRGGQHSGRGNRRGNDRGGGNRGRGRGAYRSLDANAGQSYNVSSMEY